MSEPSDLARRVARLESSARRWRVGLLLTIAAYPTALSMLGHPRAGARPPAELTADRVSAREFVVRGKDGEGRGTFGLDGAGLPRLDMASGRSKTAIHLGMTPADTKTVDSTILKFADKGGQERLRLSVVPFGARIYLRDDKSDSTVILQELGDNVSRLEVTKGADTILRLP